MNKPAKTTLILSLFLAMTMIGQSILVTELSNARLDGFQDDPSITPTESTLPGSPDGLAHEAEEYEQYSEEDASYYYRTHLINASDYCLTWLYQIYALDNFNLYLYSNESYTVQVDSSTGTLFESDVMWVIYRPSATQRLYPVVTTPGIFLTFGNARIEAESGDRINLSTEYSVSLSSTECGELYVVNLTASKSYTMNLVIPSGCDFDMFVFRIAAGENDQVDYHSSTRDAGENEKVNFRPDYSDEYAIVVIWESGSGTATLTVSTRSGIPSFGSIFVLIALISLISISLNKRKEFTLI